ncbi:hypothetical protein SAICODRAFT_8668 [Saitoella complicata NRRL Y-17804]|uniref:uncharacterized protein n=1 Tax=Saitoella complicata (strain BCRC 22490 / CBS 7301 / JCM 7358 / NBRC 10748 / NRRL Y-17804) TaxID=698492 RepID=UPI0008671B9B|nr:uncharacterized protein SAICODRAFT_8668 [Saitoella complicata NRRL Y-17804]ODQ51739.1 hypothetical protein SAICODRAFT_8668 [Saitoella complicata NRRL Y-17804]
MELRGGTDAVVRCLSDLGLQAYNEKFIEEGFTSMPTLMDITEQDLVEMSIKRGHRRLLQREIASRRGIPINEPLPLEEEMDESRGVTPAMSWNGKDREAQEEFEGEKEEAVGGGKRKAKAKKDNIDQETGKRKYRRHPKTDPNAPEKPASAYVVFANSVREELKKDVANNSLSFTDIAKIVGDRWKLLDPEEKERMEDDAARKKEDFANAMLKYRSSQEYYKYQVYLTQFREKHPNADLGEPAPKKSKLEKSMSKEKSDMSEMGMQMSRTPRRRAHSTTDTPSMIERGLSNASSSFRADESPELRHLNTRLQDLRDAAVSAAATAGSSSTPVHDFPPPASATSVGGHERRSSIASSISNASNQYSPTATVPPKNMYSPTQTQQTQSAMFQPPPFPPRQGGYMPYPQQQQVQGQQQQQEQPAPFPGLRLQAAIPYHVRQPSGSGFLPPSITDPSNFQIGSGGGAGMGVPGRNPSVPPRMDSAESISESVASSATAVSASNVGAGMSAGEAKAVAAGVNGGARARPRGGLGDLLNPASDCPSN